MQVTCLRENLSRGLANISRAVAARATLPVTQNVLLESDNGQLKLTATNTEISISTWIGAQIEGGGSVWCVQTSISASNGDATTMKVLTAANSS